MLEIFGYSALFCIPVLIPLAASSHNNENAFRLDPNQTYEGFDDLAMGNVEVSALRFLFSAGGGRLTYLLGVHDFFLLHST